MASQFSSSQYICGNCIRHLSRRPSTYQLPIRTLQTSHYATSTASHLKAKQDSSPKKPIDTTRLRARAAARKPSSLSPSKAPRLNAPLRRTKRPDQATPERLKALRNNNVAGVYKRVFPWDVVDPNRPLPPLVADILQPEAKEPVVRKQYLATPTQEELEPSKPTLFKPAKPATHHKLHFGRLESWNWYWETLAPSIASTLEANRFFTKDSTAQFLRSVSHFRNFPESDVPEVAFVGRSNVGKSSLLNAIVNADTKTLLARTSKTPGFTRTMNLYGVGGADGIRVRKGTSGGHDKIVGMRGLVVVDMPGYGEGSLAEWGAEIMKYVQGRKQLRRVFVLVDAQHGIKDKDRSLLASLRLAGVSHQVILSKLDRVYLPTADSLTHYFTKRELQPTGSKDDLNKKMLEIKEEIQPQRGGSALGELLACSAEILVDGRLLGIDSIRFAMLQAVGHQFGHDKAKARERIRIQGKKKWRVMNTSKSEKSGEEGWRMKKNPVRSVESERSRERLGVEGL
jgi:GTP-binding protein